MRAFLARILASQGIRQVLAKIQGRDYTEKSYALQMRYDLNTSSWKMSQQSLLGPMENGSEQSLATLPKEGLMRSGVVYRLPKLVLNINGIDGGSWPTPQANKTTKSGGLVNADGTPWDGISKPHSKTTGRQVTTALADVVNMWPTPQARGFRSGDNPDGKRAARKREQGWSQNLNDVVLMWPTPAARDYKGGRKPETLEASGRGESNSLNDAVTIRDQHGRLNPQFVEWLMMWPIGYTRTHGTKSKHRSGESQMKKRIGRQD